MVYPELKRVALVALGVGAGGFVLYFTLFFVLALISPAGVESLRIRNILWPVIGATLVGCALLIAVG